MNSSLQVARKLFLTSFKNDGDPGYGAGDHARFYENAMKNRPVLTTKTEKTDSRELTMARSMCWHCQSEVSGEYFCGRCIKVQPLSKELDYFTCLNLPRKLLINEKELEETFYAMSRSFHPDFFANKDESEQAVSLGNTALLNTAYRTLKDPIQRAEYLIRLEAGSAKDIRSAPPAELFEEILELQEDLEEFKSKSVQADGDELAALRGKLETDREGLNSRLKQIESSLHEQFRKWDDLPTGEFETKECRDEKDRLLNAMQELLSNRTYVRNIVHELIETISA